MCSSDLAADKAAQKHRNMHREQHAANLRNLARQHGQHEAQRQKQRCISQFFCILVFHNISPLSKSLNRAPFWALPSWLFHKGIPASFKPAIAGTMQLCHRSAYYITQKSPPCPVQNCSVRLDHGQQNTLPPAGSTAAQNLRSVCLLSPAGAPPAHRADR